MIVLGLGSNIGDREGNIRRAVELLAARPGITVEKTASFYETEPVGYVEQEQFLNTVVQVKTDLSPRDLLAVCLDVELQMGRVRELRWGPRNIDIDLLVFDNVDWNDAELVLPHPRLQDRKFVLVPLQELAAGEKILYGERIEDLLDRTQDESQVVKYAPFSR